MSRENTGQHSLSLSHDLTAIEHWCMSNRFVINVQKSSVMIICSRQKRKFINVDNFNLKLYGSILPLVSQQKILGLTIDDNLTWKEHIVSLCNRLSSLTDLLYRILTFLDLESRLLFYNSYILPRIDYCLNIWGSASKELLDKIFKIQKRAGRSILCVSPETSSTCVFDKLRWMSVYQRIIYHKYLVMCSIINNLSPVYLKQFIQCRHISQYHLRSDFSNNLSLPFPHTELFKKSLQYSGAKLWNALPVNVKESKGLVDFKIKCKQYI